MQIEITVFSKAGGLLCKSIWAGADGRPVSDGSACRMSHGQASRVWINSIGELADIFERLDSNQAISLGMLRPELPDKVDVVTKRALAKGANGAIARTAENLVYRRRQPALALFDYDTKGMPGPVKQRITDAGGWWPALVSVLPALKTAGYLQRLSTSAGLFRVDTGEKFPGSGGLHGYVEIVDGADAVRFLKTLHARCWLAGLGWMNVGAAGQLLERSIVDRMVGAPERLVFEAPPEVKPPLRQDAVVRRPNVVAGEVLDTVRACPELNVLDQQSFDQLRAQAKQRLRSECAIRRAAWIAKRVVDLVARTGMSAAEAKVTLEKQADGLLLASIELEFDDEELAGATVAAVLDDASLYVGETLADPVEGVADGHGKAKVMMGDDGLPFIHSFTHGHAVYKLRYDAAAVQERIMRAADAVAELVRLIGASELNAVENTRLVYAAAERAEVGVRDVRAVLKAAIQELADKRRKAARERALAERTDPRVLQERPYESDEWLPVIAAIDTAAVAIPLVDRKRRDIDGTLTCERRMPISRTHAFEDANEPEEEKTDGKPGGT